METKDSKSVCVSYKSSMLDLTFIFSEQVRMLLKLYEEEQYFLVVNQLQTDFEVFVTFKVTVESLLCFQKGQEYQIVKLEFL